MLGDRVLAERAGSFDARSSWLPGHTFPLSKVKEKPGGHCDRR